MLMPWGPFMAMDGRGPFLYNEESERAIMAQWAAREGTDIVVDFEHQTLFTAKNGKPAPASGWIKKMVSVAGRGLFAFVEWTAEAAAMIAAKQYRYISPVFLTSEDDGGTVLEFRHAGLVNDPGLSARNQAISMRLEFAAPQSNQPTGDSDMSLAQLRGLFALKSDATEQEVADRVLALKKRADELETEAIALKANQFDPKKHVKHEDLKAVNDELVALKASIEAKEKGAFIEQALKEGKLTVALKGWAEGQSLESLKAFVKDAPVVAPGEKQTKGQQGNQGEVDRAAVRLKANQHMLEQEKLGIVVPAHQALVWAEKELGVQSK